MAGFVSIDHAAELAERRLPRVVRDFIDGGANDELTKADNRRAYDELMFRPSMARHFDRVETATTVVGHGISAPIMFAPIGMLGAVRPGSEVALARAAERVGSIAAHSTYANTSIEEIGRASRSGKWFQLYVLGGRSGAETLLERARTAEFDVVVVTVDTAVAGQRERDARNRVTYPIKVDLAHARRFGPQVITKPAWLYRQVRAGFAFDPANTAGLAGDSDLEVDTLFSTPPTWDDLAWIRQSWAGPIVVKGILTGDDARRAVDSGADAIVVSNHGGRQLDGAPGAVRLLPQVMSAVGDQVEVLIDGGIRRGSDVAKALALGARAVLIGRAYVWGLALSGSQGVERIWRLVADELEQTLRLLGCGSIHELGPEHLTTAGRLRAELERVLDAPLETAEDHLS